MVHNITVKQLQDNFDEIIEVLENEDDIHYMIFEDEEFTKPLCVMMPYVEEMFPQR